MINEEVFGKISHAKNRTLITNNKAFKSINQNASNAINKKQELTNDTNYFRMAFVKSDMATNYEKNKNTDFLNKKVKIFEEKQHSSIKQNIKNLDLNYLKEVERRNNIR